MKVRSVRIFNQDGTESIPALLIPAEEYAIVVEAHPNDHGRRFPLNGRSRLYFLGGLKTEPLEEFDLSDEMAQCAAEYVRAVQALEFLASPMNGWLPEP
ncbi:MAG: hypothetical protein AB199_03520 [Parcubacteria bacterium C7867-004]|nr:MAG: hypothetical protein AB199_03520 [Parcubacteria bacterium C7867-004]